MENVTEKKEAEKEKLESIYKSLNRTEDELKSIFVEIESSRKNTSVPLLLHEESKDSYWKWKDAVEVNEGNQRKSGQYKINMDKAIPDIMIEIKEVKQQNEEMKRLNEELKNEMQQMKAMLPQMMMQCLREFTKQKK